MQFKLSSLTDAVGPAATLITGSSADLSDPVTGVATDSRSLGGGELFVPLVADRDGHEFIGAALRSGALAVLSSRKDGAAIVQDHPGASVIEVADTAAALLDIGRLARRRLAGPVIGITGSVGKTSVKDLLAAACGPSRPTWVSERSFNNEIGVPLTLANAPAETEITVVEMGARGIGHIELLCSVAHPRIGVVTEVAMAHSEQFGSIEAIAEAKGELVESLPGDGCAVLNADNPWVAAMASRTQAEVLTYGAGPEADVRVEAVTVGADLRPSFTVVVAGQRYPLTLSVAGAHMAFNAAAAIAAAHAAQVPVADAVHAIASARLSPFRMEIGRTPSGALVINDAYNANPTSMAAALEALKSLGVPHRVAVVGLMAELGDGGVDEHVRIAEEMRAAGVRVIAVDCPYYGESAEHVASIEDAMARLGAPADDTAILVKGSRVAALERLADRLLSAEPHR